MTTQTLRPTHANTLSSMHRKTLAHARDSFVSEIVRPSGYPFFEWNGRVYQMDAGGLPFLDTGILFEDLCKPSQDDVLAYAAALPNWEAVNDLVAEVKSRATNRLGPDYSERDD